MFAYMMPLMSGARVNLQAVRRFLVLHGTGMRAIETWGLDLLERGDQLFVICISLELTWKDRGHARAADDYPLRRRGVRGDTRSRGRGRLPWHFGSWLCGENASLTVTDGRRLRRQAGM